ncbi:MAG: hypothetical protein O7E52_19570 [Candidatus Poribacteria bacterium]|nr:hypothetical protein [Candidatus Poribacteria bacterium]
MEIYRWEGKGFRQLTPLRFGEERDFEDLLERDAALLLENEQICVISRQTPVGKSQKIDLLALDQDGNCVVVELKRGKPSRTTIAQILEYAAAVAQFSFAELERLAQRWFRGQGREFTSLLALHSEFFGYELGGMRKSAFNRRQRLVLVSEGVDARVLGIAEYLRRIGMDLTYISYFSYQAPDEILIATKTMLGTSIIAESRQSYRYATRQLMTREGFLATLTPNEELLEVARKFFDYMDACGAIIRPRVGLVRMTIGGKWWLGAYPSKRATHFRVSMHGDFTLRHIATCRTHLPDVTPKKFGISFNIASQAHLEYAIEIFERTRNAILED